MYVECWKQNKKLIIKETKHDLSSTVYIDNSNTCVPRGFGGKNIQIGNDPILLCTVLLTSNIYEATVISNRKKIISLLVYKVSCSIYGVDNPSWIVGQFTVATS